MRRWLPGQAADRAAAALLAVHALLCWLMRAPGVETMHDDARYLLLARALREGSYRELWHVGAPWHQLYPPGYPATLALWGLPFGDRFDAFIVLNILASVATLALLYLTLRRAGLAVPALLALAPLTVNTVLIDRVGVVASEPLFIFWSMVALAAAASATDAPSSRRLALAGAAAIVAALTRTAGIALVAAILADWLVAKRWRAVAALGLASALTIGAWLAWTVLAPQQHVGASYVADVLRTGAGPLSPTGILKDRLYWATQRYFGPPMGAALTFPAWPATILDNILSGTLLALAVPYGLWELRRRWPAVSWYVVTMGALLVLWAWKDERFLIPLAPFLVTALMLGAWSLAGRGRAGVAVGVALALLLLSRGLPQTVRAIAAQSHCPHGEPVPDARCLRPDQAGFFAALESVRGLPPDATVLSAKNATVTWYTGRRTAPYNRTISLPDTAFVAALREARTDYVLLAHVLESEVSALQPRLARRCRAFAVVAMPTPRTVLLRLRAPGEAEDDAACRALETYRHATRGASFG